MIDDLTAAMRHAQRLRRRAEADRRRAEALTERAAEAEHAAAEGVRNLLLAAVDRYALGRVAPAVLIEALAALRVDDGVEPVPPRERATSQKKRRATDHPQGASDDRSAVFVKISSHTTASRRTLLRASGLQWNGRRGGWPGFSTREAIALLRVEFGEKLSIEDSTLQSPGEPPSASVKVETEAVDRTVVSAATVSKLEGSKRSRRRRPAALSVATYRVASLDAATDGRFETRTPDEQMRIVVAIVAAEGPVDLDMLVERLRDHWRMRTATGRLRESARIAVDLAARSHLMRSTGWAPEPERVWYGVPDAEIPIRDRSTLPSTWRGWQHLPPVEIAVAIGSYLVRCGPTPRTDLTTNIAHILGYGATSPAMRTKIDAVLDHLVERKQVAIHGRAIVPLDDIPRHVAAQGGWQHAGEPETPPQGEADGTGEVGDGPSTPPT